mmetsp:Transcript_46812/g.131652  ORF Transcript_46812/g.131652 Transcript_46812/m.131652 type:complete len:203 (-) Transcript_46812:377-985(-)
MPSSKTPPCQGPCSWTEEERFLYTLVTMGGRLAPTCGKKERYSCPCMACLCEFETAVVHQGRHSEYLSKFTMRSPTHARLEFCASRACPLRRVNTPRRPPARGAVGTSGAEPRPAPPRRRPRLRRRAPHSVKAHWRQTRATREAPRGPRRGPRRPCARGSQRRRPRRRPRTRPRRGPRRRCRQSSGLRPGRLCPDPAGPRAR